MKKKNYQKTKVYSKKKYPKNIITKENKMKITVVTILLLLLFVGAYITQKRTTITPIEEMIKDSILMIENTLERPIRHIKNQQKEKQEQKNLYQKYNELKKQLEQQKNQTNQIKQLKDQIQKLEQTLNLNATLLETENINATVINRNIEYWSNKITVDKGKKDGIEEGLAVLVNQGMIGIIEQASNQTSTVKLLTAKDLNQKISVKIQVGEEFAYGLLTSYDNNLLNIEDIASNLKIEKQSIVTTSGMGSKIPGGIIIGYVENITKDHFDLAQFVTVKSNVLFDHLDYVTIVKRKE